MNPATQNTMNNLLRGVSPQIKERGESEEADSLMCQEEYQNEAKQEVKNQHNPSQPAVESLINNTKNLKPKVH